MEELHTLAMKLALEYCSQNQLLKINESEIEKFGKDFERICNEFYRSIKNIRINDR